MIKKILAALLSVGIMSSAAAQTMDAEYIIEQFKGLLAEMQITDYSLDLNEEGKVALVVSVPEQQTDESSAELAYFRGRTYEADGKIIEAVESYMQASGYGDADVRVMQHAYDYAVSLMEEEEYKKAQEFILRYPSDALADLLLFCNDNCFAADMALGLVARWKLEKQDTSMMSDKQMRAFYESLVQSEMEHIGKYTTMGFSDPVLAEHAYAYIGALQNQLVGASLYGKDLAAYTEYWQVNGIDVSQQMLYLLHRKIGLEIPEEYSSNFSDMFSNGKLIDTEKAIALSFSRQLIEKELIVNPSGLSAEIEPFVFYNLSEYEIYSMTAYVNFLNAAGQIVERSHGFFHGTNMGTGYEISFNDNFVGCREPFDRIEIQCDYQIGRDVFYPDLNMSFFTTEDYTVRIAPKTQFAWDGKRVIKNRSVEVEASFVLADSKGIWKKNNSAGMHMPHVEITIQNDSTVNADSVVVSCVFVNPDTKVIWDEEKIYMVSSSTTPLQAGYSKLAFVTSSVGTNATKADLPNMIAEIYVNDQAIGTVEIK